MHIMEIARAMGALMSLSVILFGSLWLKQYLKGYSIYNR